MSDLLGRESWVAGPGADVGGRRVTVIGAARSGLAAAKLFAAKGADVFLTEQGMLPEAVAADLTARGIAYEDDGHTARAINADFFVVSPGVPTEAPLIQEALKQDLPVYSEVEAASWFANGPIAAITGTNGKTTTTSLLGFIVQQSIAQQSIAQNDAAPSGRRVAIAGNIGRAFADAVLASMNGEGDGAETTYVLEVSSFQLDHVATFRPKAAVLLNVTPDHLNRYQHSYERYVAAKLRLFESQQPGDWLIYNHDDALVRDHALRIAAEQGTTPYAFSIDAEVPRGAFVRDDQIVLRLPTDAPASNAAAQPTDSSTPPHPSSPTDSVLTDTVLMDTRDLALRGRHNLYNSLAAAITARAIEIRSDVIRESLMSFEGVPHRLETVRSVGGVRFVNDSKATNVNAVWYALESFSEPIVLIAGGRDKGNDYEPIKALVKERVKAVIGLGESGDKVLLELGDLADTSARAYTMEEAVQYARLLADPSDVVLLSPACASFDMYANYEERGDDFKRLVHSL
ncbi:MAG: UDP-N-acetylmuramoyl-L-alanine--D-glutamate ligase [Bacteroidota bacterium]